MTKARAVTAGLSAPATKTELAKQLGLARSSLYYEPKRLKIDLEVKGRIEAVLSEHPAYGHKRIAIELKLNRKRILRVMKLFGLKPYRRRATAPDKPADRGKPALSFPNHLIGLCPIRPHAVWAADFTYLPYGNGFIYLATIIDLYTREIVGWQMSRWHNAELVLGALKDAVATTGQSPQFFHSDQGSEYHSARHAALCRKLGIEISMSEKASPWQNGFQESFYSQFKLELGQLSRFGTLGELIEAVHLQVHYYNTKRIHSRLKMPPSQFQASYIKNQAAKVCKPTGA